MVRLLPVSAGTISYGRSESGSQKSPLRYLLRFITVSHEMIAALEAPIHEAAPSQLYSLLRFFYPASLARLILLCPASGYAFPLELLDVANGSS